MSASDILPTPTPSKADLKLADDLREHRRNAGGADFYLSRNEAAALIAAHVAREVLKAAALATSTHLERRVA